MRTYLHKYLVVKFIEGRGLRARTNALVGIYNALHTKSVTWEHLQIWEHFAEYRVLNGISVNYK